MKNVRNKTLVMRAVVPSIATVLLFVIGKVLIRWVLAGTPFPPEWDAMILLGWAITTGGMGSVSAWNIDDLYHGRDME